MLAFIETKDVSNTEEKKKKKKKSNLMPFLYIVLFFGVGIDEWR